MKAALKQAARDEKRLDGLVANYQVRKWYRQNQTGRLPRWMKPIPCLTCSMYTSLPVTIAAACPSIRAVPAS